MIKKPSKLQRILIIATVVTIVIVVTSVIYSLGFLSNNLLRALRPEGSGGTGVTEFNIGGFEALGL